MRTSQGLSVVRTTPTIEPSVNAIIQAKNETPKVQPSPDASISHQVPSVSGTCSKKIPRFIPDVPSDTRPFRCRGLRVLHRHKKSRIGESRHPASMPRLYAVYTPLSFGFLNASWIAGVIGKFMLSPLGGTGLVNHLA